MRHGRQRHPSWRSLLEPEATVRRRYLALAGPTDVTVFPIAAAKGLVLGIRRSGSIPHCANVSPDLLFIAATRQVAHAHGRPTKLRHQFREAPKCAGFTVALGRLKQVQQVLTANTLQAIELDLAADTLQRC